MHLHRLTSCTCRTRRPRRFQALTAVAALAALAASPSQAGRPLVTEDAGVLERGDCELETYASRLRERSAPTTNGWSLQVGCGVGLRTQVALAATSSRSDGANARGLTLVGKTGLAGTVGQGAAYTLAWTLASGDETGGSHYKLQEIELKGVATVPLADQLGLHANLGWARDQQTRESSVRWALALEYAASRQVDLMAETFASNREKSPWVQFGLRWAAVPERLFLDGSVGVQTTGLRPRQVTVGLKAPF